MKVKELYLITIFVFVCCFIFGASCFGQAVIKEEKKEDKQKLPQQLIVYSDMDSSENHFYPSGKIADVEAIEIDEGWKVNPQSGTTCIKITYKAIGSFGWAGIYWLNPKDNWGEQKGGFDLSFAKKLTFWAKGEKGGEHIAVFKFGGLKGFFPDSDNHGIGPVVLTDKWQEYTVDISSRNMRYISAGFSFALTKAHNRKGCIFYLDNIKYE